MKDKISWLSSQGYAIGLLCSLGQLNQKIWHVRAKRGRQQRTSYTISFISIMNKKIKSAFIGLSITSVILLYISLLAIVTYREFQYFYRYYSCDIKTEGTITKIVPKNEKTFSIHIDFKKQEKIISFSQDVSSKKIFFYKNETRIPIRYNQNTACISHEYPVAFIPFFLGLIFILVLSFIILYITKPLKNLHLFIIKHKTRIE